MVAENTDLEAVIDGLKQIESKYRQSSIKILRNQPTLKAAIPLAECAFTYPNDIWQGCEIIKILRKMPSSKKRNCFCNVIKSSS